MAKRRAKKRAKRTSAEAFIKAWKKGGTPQEVATRLGISRGGVYNRAEHYRAKGIKLPKLKDGRLGAHGLDVAALNKLVRG